MNRALEQSQIFRPVRSPGTSWTFWLLTVVSVSLLGPALWQQWSHSNNGVSLWISAGISLVTTGLVALLLVYPQLMAYRADAGGIHIRGMLGWFTVARADIIQVKLEEVHLVWRTLGTGAPGLFYGRFVEKRLQNVRAYSSLNQGKMVVIYTRSRGPVFISPDAAQVFLSTLERLGYPMAH